MVQDLESCRKKVVGKPYEGEPHVRFEVAGARNVIRSESARQLPTLPAVLKRPKTCRLSTAELKRYVRKINHEIPIDSDCQW